MLHICCVRCSWYARWLAVNRLRFVWCDQSGVPEDDRASEALDFALKFELLTKEEAKRVTLRTIDDFGDPDNFSIPRCEFWQLHASDIAESFASI